MSWLLKCLTYARNKNDTNLYFISRMTPFKHSDAVFIPDILIGSLPPKENSSQKIGDAA